MKRLSLNSTLAASLFCLFAITGKAQNPVPASAQAKPITILHGTAHLGNGKVISDAAVTFENGKIVFVGSAADVKVSTGDNNVLIDATGKYIYPGLINCNSTIGLTEVDMVRSTRDFSETGDYNPNVRSAIAYNTDSKIIPTVRSNGVLLAEVAPQSGTITGQSSVMQLDGWNWEDALYKADVGIHLHWPSMRISKTNENDPEEKQRERIFSRISKLEAYFKEAKAYSLSKKPDELNLRFEAMRGLLDDTKKLFVHAHYIKEIESAIGFCNRLGLKMVLVGGSDSWMATNLLRKNNIPVIILQTHNLPPREDSDVDLPYRLPSLLQKDSILFAIAFDGSWNTRNLPFEAGTAVAYGLTREEALQAITLSPAKILGIDSQTGSLEVGKDANIIISTGDVLDMRTSNIEKAFIKGRDISLDNVQKQLYRKYKDKYKLN
jgi:imidazolonepropionase-like amidohydrolase